MTQHNRCLLGSSISALGQPHKSIEHKRGILLPSFSSFATLIIVLALSLVLTAFSYSVAAETSKKATLAAARGDEGVTGGLLVTDIEFRGNYTASPDFLRKGLRTRVGRPLSARTIDEDVKQLFKEGRFTATRVGQEPHKGGIRVVFFIEENPICWRVEYEGKGANASRLRELTSLRPGKAVSPHITREDENKIEEHFKNLGYAFAKASNRVSLVTQPGERGAIVTYIIDRGPKVLVDRLDITGAKSIKLRTLKGQMKTKLDHWWNSSRFVEKNFRGDITQIRDYYRFKGWLDVIVTADEPRFAEDNTGVELAVHIEEGPRYIVQSIAFEGLTAVQQEKFLPKLKMQSGSFFSEENLNKDTQRIEHGLQALGYANARVRPERKFAEEGDAIVLKYVVSEGEVVNIRRIDVSGNTKTKSVVILRELTIDPGDQYNVSKVRESEQRLRETGFFEKVSSRLVDTVPASPHEKNLVMEVEEKDTGRFSGGAGFSSINNFFAVISFDQRNFDYSDLPPTGHDWLTPWRWFQGDGQQFRVSLSPGSLRNRYELFFLEPWLLDKPISFSTNLYLVDSEFFSDYSESRFGFRTSIGKRYENGFFMDGAYKIDRIKINNMPEDATTDSKAVEGVNWISGVQYSLGLRRTDSRLLPSRGYNIQADFEVDGSVFGGDFDIWKAKLTGDWHYTLLQRGDGGKHILNLSGLVGFAGAYSSTDEMPIYERYFAGSSIVRGFAPRELGPRGETAIERIGPVYTITRTLFPWLPERYRVQETEEPIGGDFLFASTIEYGFPIFRDEDHHIDILRGIIFLDAGTLEEGISGDALNRLRSSVGIGCRFIVPTLGNVPVKIDLGFPISKEDEDETQAVTFSMGTYF